MQNYQQEFMEFLVRTQALRFGEFTLKSGRKSPYLFNSGQFNCGGPIEQLDYYYTCALRELSTLPTLIFGEGNRKFKRYFWSIGKVPKRQHGVNRPVYTLPKE